MAKKKKLVGVIALAVCIIACVVGCGDSAETCFYGEIFKDEDFAVRAYENAEKTTGYDVYDGSRVKIATGVENGVTYARAYDGASGKKVYETVGGGVKIAPALNGRAFSVSSEKTDAEIRRVSDGALLGKVDKTKLSALYGERAKLVRIGNNVIMQSADGETEILIENDPLVSVPSCELSPCGEYFFGLDGKRLTVYDKMLAPVIEHTVSDGAQAKAFALGDGRVIVQERSEARSDGEYSYVSDGKAVEFAHFITDAKRGKTESVSCDFEIKSLKDGIAVIARIGENKRLLPEQTVKLGSSLKIEKYFSAKLGSSLTPRCIADGKRYYDTDDGYILDETGAFVADRKTVGANKEFLITDDKIYDYGKNEVLDLCARRLRLTVVTDHALAFTTEQGEAYLFTGKLTPLGKSTTKYKNGLIEVKKGDTYEYYNAFGKKLLTLEHELYFVATCGDSAYFREAVTGINWRLY